MKSEAQRSAEKRYSQTDKGRAREAAKYASRKIRIHSKLKARYALRYAVKSGSVTKGPCEDCGSVEAEAHHDDYSKPLDVRWLCRQHHADYHRDNPQIVR